MAETRRVEVCFLSIDCIHGSRLSELSNPTGACAFKMMYLQKANYYTVVS
jgi:hypothetical protein